MANVLSGDRVDADDAAEMIRDALGIESDDTANYVFPEKWPTDREQRARIIGECPGAGKASRNIARQERGPESV